MSATNEASPAGETGDLERLVSGWRGLRPVLTEKRKKWLLHLYSYGMDSRKGKGPVACHCMRLGWTEWVYDDSREIIGERLTDAGLALCIRDR